MEYQELRKQYTYVSSQENTKGTNHIKKEENEQKDQLPEDAPEKSIIDFQSLRIINPDVLAWLEIPVLDISYPVMQAEDNDFYLHRDINKEYLYSGSIFLDYQNASDFSDQNSILFGHNMSDRSMFGKLKDLQDQNFIDECPYIWISTPETDYLFKIFSVHRALNGSDTFTLTFSKELDFNSWKDNRRDESIIFSNVVHEDTANVLTLITCTEDVQYKLAVHAVKIYQNEKKDKQNNRILLE